MKKRPIIIPPNSAELDAAWKLFEWNGSLRLTAKLGENGVTGGVIKSKQALYRACHNLEHGGWDIYVGANPARGTGIKAATREVEVWRYLVIDLDPIAPECAPELAIEQALIEGSGMVHGLAKAATVAFTGRGAQAWVGVSPHYLRDSSSSRAEVERGMGAFLHRLRLQWGDRLGYRIDTSTSDLARIVRCPGTINTKTGRRARVIRQHIPILEDGSPTCHQLDVQEIIRLAGPAPPEPVAVVDEKCSNLNIVAPHLNDRARKFLREGLEEGERHKSAYAAAANLRELGVHYSNAVAWVLRGGRKCRPKLRAGDCQHAVNEAWKGR